LLRSRPQCQRRRRHEHILGLRKCSEDRRLLRFHYRQLVDDYFLFDLGSASATFTIASSTTAFLRSTSATVVVTTTSTDSSTTNATLVPASSSSATPESSGEGATYNTGAIIGGVVGCFALVCISAIAVVWLLRRNRRARAASPGPAAGHQAPPVRESVKVTDHTAGGFGPGELPGYRQEQPPMRPVELYAGDK
jgi:hypothetical protein